MVHASKRWVGFVLALLGGSAWGFTSSSCVALDHCILIVLPGDDWCRPIVGAKRWPPGSEDLAVLVVLENDQWPEGCVCFNDAESEILDGGVPAAIYAELAQAMEQAARDECDALVPEGWDHNCYEEGPNGPVIGLPTTENAGDCVGDCFYVNEPKGGCGDDPNPYECEDGETGGDDDSGTETGDTDSGTETDTGGRPAIEGATEWTR